MEKLHPDWVDGLADAMMQSGIRPLLTETGWLASDYSAAASGIQTLSFLACDLSASAVWKSKRLSLRRRSQGAPSHHEFSFKKMRDGPIFEQYRRFLDATDGIVGHIVTFTTEIDLVSSIPTNQEISIWKADQLVTGAWNKRDLWRALAIARAATAITHSVFPNIRLLRWISDDDAVFDTSGRSRDFATMMAAAWRNLNGTSLETIRFRTCGQPTSTFVFRDLASVADLACGIVHESKLPVQGREKRQKRTTALCDWLNTNEGQLSKWHFSVTDEVGRETFQFNRFKVAAT